MPDASRSKDAPQRGPALARWLPGLVLTAAALVVFRKALFSGEMLFFADIATQNYPWKAFFAEKIRSGHLPLWYPYMQSGFPLYAEIQAGFFYPPNWAAFALLPVPLAYGVLMALHLLLCGGFAYLFARTQDMPRGPALFTALAFTLCAFFFLHVVHLALFITACWLPVEFFLLEKALRRRRAAWLMIVSPAVALQVLAGHPQIVAYSLAALSVRVLLHGAACARRRAAGRGVRVLAFWAAAVAAGMLIASVQLLPTLELIGHSARSGGISSAFAAEQSMPPYGLVTYLLPDFFGYATPEKNVDYWLFDIYYWDLVPYMGILPLLLALVPLFHRAPGLTGMFYLMLACSLVLMLGAHTPVYQLLLKIPPFYYFRAPARFSLLASFSLALLAGSGLGLLLAGRGPRASPRALRALEKISGALLGLLLAGTALAHAALAWFQAPIRDALMRVGDAYVREHIHGKGLFFKPLDYYLEKVRWAADTVVERLGHALDPQNPRVAAALGCAAAAYLLLALFRRGRLGPRGFLAGCTVLLVSDLFLFGLRYNPTLPVDRALSPSPEAALLRQDPRPFRVFRDVRVPEGEALREKRLLPVSLGGLWGIASADEFTPLKMDRHAALLDRVKRDPEYVLHGVLTHRNLLSLMGVRHVLSLRPITNLARVERDREDGILVYRNDRALPPLSFVTDWVRVRDRQELERAMADPETDFARTAVLEEAPPFPRSPDCAGAARIRIQGISADMDRVQARVAAPCPGLLVYGVTWYPGWSARVDGQPRPLVRVDSIYQGVFLEAGDHRVELAYRPTRLKAGALLSLVSLLGWGGGVALLGATRGSRPERSAAAGARRGS